MLGLLGVVRPRWPHLRLGRSCQAGIDILATSSSRTSDAATTTTGMPPTNPNAVQLDADDGRATGEPVGWASRDGRVIVTIVAALLSGLAGAVLATFLR